MAAGPRSVRAAGSLGRRKGRSKRDVVAVFALRRLHGEHEGAEQNARADQLGRTRSRDRLCAGRSAWAFVRSGRWCVLPELERLNDEQDL